MGIKEKLEILGLPLEFADSSFAATINLIEVDWAKKIQNYLVYYGVAITKASELKLLTYDDMEIKKVLVRLQYYKDMGLNIVDEKGHNLKYLYELGEKHSTFNLLHPDLDLSNVTPDVFRDKESIDETLLATLDKDATVGLTEDNYDKYIRLEGILTNVMQEVYGTNEFDSQISNNIIKLISTNNNYTDSDILFAALLYNQNRSAEEISTIKNAISKVMESLKGGTVTR